MEEKKNYNSELITSILGILILIVLIFSTSYAVTVNEENSGVNTLTMGYLSFNFAEDNDGMIKLNKANVLNDSDAVTSKNDNTFYSFSIENDFNKDINYEILLEPIMGEVDFGSIKLCLTDDKDEECSSSKVMSLLDLEDSSIDGNKILYKDTLKATSMKKFNFRVWISDSNKDINDDTSFIFKIDVKGTI